MDRKPYSRYLDGQFDRKYPLFSFRFVLYLFLLVLPFSISAQGTGKMDNSDPEPAIKTDTNYIRWIHRRLRFAEYSDSMLKLSNDGYRLASALGDEKGRIQMLLRKSHLLQTAGDVSNSLNLSVKALRSSEKLKDSILMVDSYHQILWLYSDQQNYDQVLSWGYTANEFTKLIGDDWGRCVVLEDMGDTYEKLGVLDSARYYTQQGYELAVKLDKTLLQGIALNNLGNIYSKMASPEIALGYYRKSISLLRANDYEQTETYLGMAQIFQQAGELDSALHYGQLSLGQADSVHYVRRQMLACKFIADVYDRSGPADSTLAYLKKFILYKDSVYSADKSRQVMVQTFREQEYQREMSEERAQAEERRRHNIQLAGIGAFIPLFFTFVLLLSKTKVKPRVIEVLGLIGLVLFFQFVELLIHPYIASVSGHTPIVMLLLLVGLAGLLIPFHKRLEHWVKNRLARRG